MDRPALHFSTDVYIDGLYRRFGIVKVCIVADRGMISQETINDLDQQDVRVS